MAMRRTAIISATAAIFAIEAARREEVTSGILFERAGLPSSGRPRPEHVGDPQDDRRGLKVVQTSTSYSSRTNRTYRTKTSYKSYSSYSSYRSYSSYFAFIQAMHFSNDSRISSRPSVTGLPCPGNTCVNE